MIEVFKQMVEALEYLTEQTRPISKTKEAIQAGKQAIAELESQEPFCYAYKENGEDFFAPKDGYYPADAKPLYTHPPQRTEKKPCAKHCEATAFEIVIKNLQGEIERMKTAQRTWVGLTEQQSNDIEDVCEMIIGKPAFDAIERQLKENNT
jgi:hypothetical protein